MTATQVFLYFLKHELDPIERQAFITEIEKEFDVKIDDNELSEIKTVGDIIKKLKDMGVKE